MDKITTTIQRQWLREIIAQRKKVEYREIKPYWKRRFDVVKAPFLLRLINGMQEKAPEVTVEIVRVRTNKLKNRYELRIGKIVNTKNWDRKREVLIMAQQRAATLRRFRCASPARLSAGVTLAFSGNLQII